MKKVLNDYIVALEQENTSGIVNTETEYVFYAKLKDPDILRAATAVEDQEQWTLKIPKTPDNLSEGTMRVRKTKEGNSVTYALTIKTRLNAPQGDLSNTDTQVAADLQKMLEVTIEATEDCFEMFKRMADSGMIKTRYTLPIQDSDCVFEVDRFITSEGQYSQWVKIDLEVKVPLSEIPQLPEGFTDVIYNQKGKQSEQESEFVTRLYDQVFLTKNKK